MYDNVVPYRDAHGNCPVMEFQDLLNEKASRGDKKARVLLEKVLYLEVMLSVGGTRIGMPHCRHIEDDLWELRPFDYRILFFFWSGKYVLLHPYLKQGQKLPLKEKEKAFKEIYDWRNRHGS
ncbi:MAG: type II toxin-antitoxin system RelE/ParE family toxin [Tumebacillaceae bacterium]